MYYVYIIESGQTISFYIGCTENIEKRLWHHNEGLNKSTRKANDWKVVYKEEYKSKSEALKRERFLKKQRNKHFYNRLIKGCREYGT